MQKVKQVIIKIVKIMSKNIEDKENKVWSLSIGTYPGILLGVRTYNEDQQTTHVLYLPFIDLALEVYK
jgi:hypothetical protein